MMEVLPLSFLSVSIAMSVLAVWMIPATGSRRRLIVALSVAVPVAGPILALLVSRVRGTGARVERGDLGDELPEPLDIEQVQRLGELPSLLELLLSADSGDRQSALVVLSARADADAVRILRWAVEHGRPETVLEAALTLGELDFQFEFELADAEDRLRDEPSAANTLAAATVITEALHSGLSDPAIAVGLAARARELFTELLRGDDPESAEEARVQLARLELTMGNPGAAVTLLEGEQDSPRPERRRLYERARFRARSPLGAASAPAQCSA